MSARVLVVDDIETNRKLLEAKLSAEYYDVVTACGGQEALEIVACEPPDIVLLDVMMPDIDGFEVCRRIKSSTATTHIPVIMITALDQPADRIAGLEAGADDFLTKPVDDLALFARVRNLVRLKFMTDEWRMQQIKGETLGVVSDALPDPLDVSLRSARIVLVEDNELSAQTIRAGLGEIRALDIETEPEAALPLIKNGGYDLVIVSLALTQADGLRLCAQMRTMEETRHLPILVLVDKSEKERLTRALEVGVNDCLLRPIERNELIARVRTQIRRQRYYDRLRRTVQLSMEMAITDQLTGLYNRRYMEGHLEKHVSRSIDARRPLSILALDIDHFKAVNDTHGHDIGDEVLREFAKRINDNVRGLDLACRAGGEEFIIILPDTELRFAEMVAERIRRHVGTSPFDISIPPGRLDLTVSIGVAVLEDAEDTTETLLRRADQALYAAKRDGRNRVSLQAA